MSDDLTRAKQHPLHELVQSWGVRLTKGATGNYWRGKCPLHEDKSPSFSIVKHADGQYSWKCHAGCGHGTIVDLLMMREGLAKAAAIARSLEVAGIERSTGGGRRMEFGAAAAPAAAAVATVTARAPLSDEWLKVLHDATERLYNLSCRNHLPRRGLKPARCSYGTTRLPLTPNPFEQWFWGVTYATLLGSKCPCKIW